MKRICDKNKDINQTGEESKETRVTETSTRKRKTEPETFSEGHPALILISWNPIFLAIADAVRMSVGQDPPSWSTKGSSTAKFDSK